MCNKNIPKVSIVLAVYNVEKYLERCLNTIVNQTLKDIEIIIVDDESPDNCPQICEQWARKDNRIKVIHKKNEGLGMARNTGIENATGEYICFFDSDDYIDLETVEKAYKLAKKEQAEIVTFGFCHVEPDGNIRKKTIPNLKKNVYEGREVQEEFLPNLIANDPSTGEKTNLWMSAWASIYSTSLISRMNWRFVSEREIISEDIYSLLYLYKGVTKVAVLSEALYYYCRNDVSLTHTYRKDRYEKIKEFYIRSVEASKKLGYTSKITERLVYPYIANTIGALKMIVAANSSKKERKKELKKIISDNQFQEIIKKIDIKKESLARKLLFIAMRKKMYIVCYVFIKIKDKR